MKVIPSIQGIHMSSDRPWAIDRLGKKRIEESAYVWRDLIDHGAILINGSDVPVEPIDPIASFYASTTRKTLKGFPDFGYEPKQKMTRMVLQQLEFIVQMLLRPPLHTALQFPCACHYKLPLLPDLPSPL